LHQRQGVVQLEEGVVALEKGVVALEGRGARQYVGGPFELRETEGHGYLRERARLRQKEGVITLEKGVVGSEEGVIALEGVVV